MVPNRGYLLGRLFALLATLEVLDESPEQLYQKAAATPPQVLPAAIAKAIATGKEEALFPLLNALPLEAFDSGLNRREQGAFSIGYVHERTGRPVPLPEEETDDLEPELTDRYEFRIDPQLKEWLKTQGGGGFVRTILRAEKVKQTQGEER